MKKCLLTAILVAMFMVVAAFAWGQSVFYDEPFNADQGWTLDPNWSIRQSSLRFSWTPQVINYDLSASSPTIVVPATAADMVVSQFINQYPEHGSIPDTFEIIAVAGGVPHVLWFYDANIDWGVNGGQDLVLSLAPYAGQTIQLKFRVTGMDTYHIIGWAIYGISAHTCFNHDLAATSLSGSVIPALGSAHPYVVSVRNAGLTAVNDYTVKLLQSGDVELGFVAGASIAPGETIEYTIPWTPTVPGNTQIWAEVVRTGDENPQNDNTYPLAVTVIEANMLVAEIGNGTAANTISSYPTPYGTVNKAFRQQFLYTANELFAAGAAPGMISALAFNVLGLHTCSPMPNYTIRLKHTDQTALVRDFEPGAYTTVWQRPSFMPVLGWNNHNFDLPFMWNGNSNIIVDITTNLISGNVSRNAMVYYSPTAYESSLGSAGNAAHGSAATWGYTSFNRSNIRFFMVPTETPALAVSPESHNFGDVILGYVGNQDFNVINAGIGSLIVNSINISGSPDFTISALPALPAQISLGAPISFHVKYTPTSAGNHTATITITDNLRLIHTLEISGNGVDYTIYEPGYIEDFDGVETPSLPLGWNKFYADPGYVITIMGAGPHSPPNCLGMAGFATLTNPIMLIAPPLAHTIPINNVRVKFWQRHDNFLEVGVMTDPEDASSFVAVETLISGYDWRQQQVSLSSYTGNGRFIAFKLPVNLPYHVIFIDTVEFEMMGEIDLKTLALSGASMPNLNAASEYIVSVYNNSTAPQSNYAVKLVNGDDVVLATTLGTTIIAPGNTLDIAVSWIPTILGPMSIRGKVVLAGDVNPGNDASRALSICVQPAGAIPVTIGVDHGSYIVPIDFSSAASIYEYIYSSAEIGTDGTIHTIAVYNEFNSGHIGNRQVQIWMGLTDQQTLDSGWISSNDMTLVFDGMINFPGGENTIVFPLQLPFVYDGYSNLVVMFKHPPDGQYDVANNGFKCHAGPDGRARLKITMGYDPDPTNLTGGDLFGIFPQTTLMLVPNTQGQILGTVKRANGTALAGAAVGTEDGFNTITNSTGAYSLFVPVGIYSVTAAFGDFNPVTHENVIVLSHENTTVNFVLDYASNDDETVPIAATALRCNYPNPFNPETTISYDLKDPTSVRLNVYNTKGQLVRSLVNTDQAAGSYRVVFNGRDDKGSPLASGIYLYRFTAGRYNSIRKMILMK